jgi:O-antigen ligase
MELSIRVVGFTCVVLYVSVYAWRHSWFNALCAMIVLMAFLEHKDMPRAIGGIAGLNLWNFLYLNVFLAWRHQRSLEGLVWDLPGNLTRAIWLYWIVVVVAALRLLIDPTQYYDSPFTTSVIDNLINPIKVFLPCLMLYDGCRDRERVRLALGAIMLAYVLLALQAVKYMGIGSLGMSGTALSARAIRVLDRVVGYHRVDMSMIFAGAFWALIAYAQAFTSRKVRWAILVTVPLLLLGQAVTGGRTGYATWILVGLILGFLRWRKFLLLVPVGVVMALAFMPSVRDRMLSGFGGGAGPVKTETDLMAVTSGRTAAWPLVIDEIKEAPLIGYGKEAMKRTGLHDWIEENKGGDPTLSGGFSHPHNAYLEMLFDNGILGFLCVAPIFFHAFTRSLGLFLRANDPLFVAAGGVSTALVLALLIAAMGSQTFYPRIGCFGMWAAIGVAWRVVEMRRQAQERYDDGDSDEDEFLDHCDTEVDLGNEEERTYARL